MGINLYYVIVYIKKLKSASRQHLFKIVITFNEILTPEKSKEHWNPTPMHELKA